MRSLVEKYMVSSFLRAPEVEGGAPAGGAPAGGAPGPWYSSHNFDADTVAWIEERKFPDLGETLKAGREGSKLARDRNVIAKPDPKNLKSWDGFAELGWNPDKEKYVINKPQLKDGETIDDATFNTFATAAHAARIPAFQAEAIFNAMHEMEQSQVREAATRGADAKRALDQQLRKDWGPDYDTKIEGAKRAFAFLGGEDFKTEEIAAAIGSPRTAKLFAKLHDLIGEDKMPGAGGQGGGFQTETVAGLQAELNRLHADPEFRKARDNPQHPRHKDVIAQRATLLEKKAQLELKARGRA